MMRHESTSQIARPNPAGLWLAVLALMGAALACNLGATSTSAPPTLAPRPSATPPPTLGASGFDASVSIGSVSTPIVDGSLEVFSLMNQVEVDRMMAHIDALQNFHTRHVNSTQTSDTRGIGAAAKYIEGQFRLIQQQSNGRVFTFPHEFRLFYNGVSTVQRNLVAVVQGTEPGAGTLVVGAHYDSIGPDFGDAEGYAPGAVDNGSGVAAVIELARVISQNRTRATVMFVAFSAEEVGRVGSIEFVKYLRTQNIDLIGMINIDGIGNVHDFNGRVNDTELRVFSDGPNDTSPSRQMARMAEFISFTHGLDLKLIVEDRPDREGRYGDHFSFSEAGYPAIRFIQANEEKRNGDRTDTIEFIEPYYLLKATRSILMVVESLASGPRPPRNISFRNRDTGNSTLVWEPVNEATGYIVALRWPGALRYDQQIEVRGTSIDWDGFRNYAGIAIAAIGPDGIVGPLSPEYRINAGVTSR